MSASGSWITFSVFAIDAALSLPEPLDGLLQLFRMWDFLTVRSYNQILESWVDTDHVVRYTRNWFALGVDKQAQIPTRSAFNDAPALDLTFWDVLLVEA